MTTPTPGKQGALSDPRIDALWRVASQEEPPAALDATILAAARREVGAGPQSTGTRQALAARRQWWPFAAAATVAAIAVGVLQLTPPEQLGAPVSEKTVITDMPAPDTKLASEAAKIVPREDAAKIPARDEVATTTPRGEAARDIVGVDGTSRRQEAAKDSVGVDGTSRRQEAAKDSATVDRKTAREDAATDVLMADRTTPRQETTKESVTVDRTAPRAAGPRAPSIAAAAPRVPSIAAAAPAPAKPETAARNATSFPEPFPAASPAQDTKLGAATSAPGAPALAGKIAVPAMPNEAPRPQAAAESASAGRMTMKGEAGGSAIVLVEPPQPAAPAAAMQGVPQTAAARPAPQVTMAKARDAERQADAERTNEMAKDRDAVARTVRARTDDRVPLPVAEWIALIRRLRDEGKTAEAAKELAAFRAAHADHERLLPRDLANWRPPEK